MKAPCGAMQLLCHSVQQFSSAPGSHLTQHNRSRAAAPPTPPRRQFAEYLLLFGNSQWASHPSSQSAHQGLLPAPCSAPWDVLHPLQLH